MKWLINIFDPSREDAKYYVARTWDESMDEAWENHKKWLVDKSIGLPKGSDRYSVAEMIEMGMVGVYSD